MAEAIEGELIEVQTNLAELVSAEVDCQIATAHRFPRVITTFKRKATELATLNEETAGSMFYSLPARGDSRKPIVGPSVRMAEVVAACWGNLRSNARIVSIEERFVTAQGVCIDLESNNAVAYESKRTIWSPAKDGKPARRYSESMIQTTCNAACAIAFREAVFKVVPRSMFMDIYEAARETSIGKGVPIATQRQKAIEHFAKLGATEAQVLAVLGKRGRDDIDVDDLINLRGLASAIKEQDITIEEAMRPPGEPEATPGLQRAAPLTPNGAKPTKGAKKSPDAPDADPGAQESTVSQPVEGGKETAPAGENPDSEPIPVRDEINGWLAQKRTIAEIDALAITLKQQYPQLAAMIDQVANHRKSKIDKQGTLV